MPLSKSTALQIGFLALLLAISGCFDWDMPSDYGQGPDGDGDADSDGDGDGTLGQGEICGDTSQCLPGYICGGNNGDPAMLCRQSCVGGDCGAHGQNSVCLTFGVGGNSCTMPCNPFYPDCFTGSNCLLIDTGDNVNFGTACTTVSGFGLDGDPCTYIEDCAIGYTCGLIDTDSMCIRLCSNPGGDDAVCLYGACWAFGTGNWLLDGRSIGGCDPIGAGM